MKRALRIFTVILVLIPVVLSIGYVASLSVDVEEISVGENDGTAIRIAHVSDLHYPHSFLSLSELATLLAEQTPDLIVFTGDIADGKATEDDITALSALFSSVTALCPSFLVIGNHEIGSDHLNLFLETARKSSVSVLLNDVTTVSVHNTEISVLGLSDGYPFVEKTLSSPLSIKNTPKILLSHRPETFSDYVSAPESIRPNLIVAGHAHGGVARMGKLALYAPNQGLFPKYTSGEYEKDNVTMIVSRGLGASGMDFRCFNRYHLPVITWRI